MRLNKRSIFTLLFILTGLSSCEPQTYNLEVPPGFSEPEIPADNPLTREKVELGKQLFFDKRLSGDFSVSCASCHIPEFAFSDTVSRSLGFKGRAGERNAPSLVNIAYKPLMFRDGGVKRIETQVHGPLENHFEMNIPRNTLLRRLQKDSNYTTQFAKVFGDAPTSRGINHALAAYQRTLIYGNSRYDQYRRGVDSALTETEKRGMELFKSERLNCTHCHSGILFTDFSFQNNGIKSTYADSGRARVTGDPDDAGKFFVPGLRNVEVTYPYMYDGSFQTLEEVVEHYAQGGKGHHNQSPAVNGFELTRNDKKALTAFLKSLTDTAFLPDDQKRNSIQRSK